MNGQTEISIRVDSIKIRNVVTDCTYQMKAGSILVSIRMIRGMGKESINLIMNCILVNSRMMKETVMVHTSMKTMMQNMENGNMIQKVV